MHCEESTVPLNSICTGPAKRALELWQDESGQDLIEYALVAALIALGAVASIKPISTKLNSLFTGISTALNTAV